MNASFNTSSRAQKAHNTTMLPDRNKYAKTVQNSLLQEQPAALRECLVDYKFPSLVGVRNLQDKS